MWVKLRKESGGVWSEWGQAKNRRASREVVGWVDERSNPSKAAYTFWLERLEDLLGIKG